jgi:hypothetical protein
MNESLKHIDYDKSADCLALANQHALLLGQDTLDQETINRSVDETTRLRRELQGDAPRPLVEGALDVVRYLPFGRAMVEMASSVEQAVRRAA